jgi:hypothetical protein
MALDNGNICIRGPALNACNTKTKEFKKMLKNYIEGIIKKSKILYLMLVKITNKVAN